MWNRLYFHRFMSFIGIGESTQHLCRSPYDLVRVETQLNFPAQALIYPIANWIHSRPSMAQEDTYLPLITRRIADEGWEVLAELECVTQLFNQTAWQKEVLDVFFLIISLASNYRRMGGFVEELDLVSLSTRLNGVGHRSDFFDRMQEVALNLRDGASLRHDVKYLVAMWFSYVRHAPLTASPEKILNAVLAKNGTEESGNYPSIYFSGLDPVTQEPLSPDEKRLQCTHSRVMLRMIRVHFHLPSNGLSREHHLPFAWLILDFCNTYQNQRLLLNLLSFSAEAQSDIAQYLKGVSVDRATSWQNVIRNRGAS